MPAATAAMATTAAPAPQNHGVFAAARITADGSLPAVLGDTDATVGALLMPDGAPTCVAVELITTVAASIGEATPDTARRDTGLRCRVATQPLEIRADVGRASDTGGRDPSRALSR